MSLEHGDLEIMTMLEYWGTICHCQEKVVYGIHWFVDQKDLACYGYKHRDNPDETLSKNVC